MKSKIKIGFLMATILLLGIGFSIFTGMAQIKSNDSAEPANELKINISSSKDLYSLGETVFLDFEVRNNSSKDVRVRGLDLDSRYITVYIAYEDQPFKQYKHSRIKDTMGGTFKSGEVVKTRSGILWNLSPTETSTNWKEMKETNILSYYAFPKAGVYTVKADFGIPSNEGPIKVESKAIQIVINEPVGDDLEVWNKIKDRQDIGFFIQEGYFRTSNPQEVNKLKQEVEQITLKHPNSLLANQISQSLERFQANEEKRKAYLEKMKKPQ